MYPAHHSHIRNYRLCLQGHCFLYPKSLSSFHWNRFACEGGQATTVFSGLLSYLSLYGLPIASVLWDSRPHCPPDKVVWPLQIRGRDRLGGELFGLLSPPASAGKASTPQRKAVHSIGGCGDFSLIMLEKTGVVKKGFERVHRYDGGYVPRIARRPAAARGDSFESRGGSSGGIR